MNRKKALGLCSKHTHSHTPVRSHTRRKKMSVNLWHILNALTTYKITSFICQHRSLLKRVAFWIISNLALYYSCTDNLLFSTSSSALCFSHRFSPIIMRYYCCDFNCTVQSTNANVYTWEREREGVCMYVQLCSRGSMEIIVQNISMRFEAHINSQSHHGKYGN